MGMQNMYKRINVIKLCLCDEKNESILCSVLTCFLLKIYIMFFAREMIET